MVTIEFDRSAGLGQFPAWWSEDSSLVVIDVAIDESKSAQSCLLVVSAIVGKTALMRKLSVEWKRELVRSGVDYFHAKEHWNGRAKAYHGIGHDEREKLLDRLIRHLHSRFLFGASVIVDEAEYRAATSERLRSQYGSPYGFGVQLAMSMVLLELNRLKRQNQPINILIEDGHVNAGQAIEFIKRKKQLNSPKGLKIGTYGLGGKAENPVLQAADLLAFGTCEYTVRGESDFAKRTVPEKYMSRFLILPWDVSSVQDLKSDIIRHRDLVQAKAPGAIRHAELVMW